MVEKKKRKSVDANGGGGEEVGTVECASMPKAQLDNLGLTYKQIYSLKASWKGIKRKMEDTGVEMFVR